MKQVKYGLLYKGKICGYTIQSNSEGRDCCDNQYELDETKTNEWLVDSKIQAEWVRNYSTKWYNAGYDTPTNPYDKEDLQVVEVIKIVSIIPIVVKLPTFEEMAKIKYYEKEREHYDYILQEKEKHKELHFNLYDYQQVLEVNKDGNRNSKR